MLYLEVDLTKKENFTKGMLVDIEVKEDIYRGYITKIISSNTKGKPIKVQIHTGEVGRIYGVPSKDEIEKETFKFYNLFFNYNQIYTVLNGNEVFVLPIQDKRIIYLYSSEEEARQAVKNTPLEQKPYRISRLKRTKHLVELLHKYNANLYIIDMDKQLSSNDLKELETRFRSM